MDWMAMALIAAPGVIALLVVGLNWLKARAPKTETKVDDTVVMALGLAADLASHNAALAALVAKTPNKLDDAALDAAKALDNDASNDKPAA